jgi:hypothetical protein
MAAPRVRLVPEFEYPIRRRSMRLFSISPVVLLLSLAPSAPGTGSATAQSAAMEGVFEVGPGAGDHVERAIRAATEGGGFFIRTVGRRLLREKLRPPPVIHIALTDSTASITDSRGDLLQTPLTEGENEKSLLSSRESVVTCWEGTTLVRTFREDDGIRRYRYTLDPDHGTLRVHVNVEGSRLPRPVEYELSYHR